MGTAQAYDFSKPCSTGQMLYYNVIDATNHYVELTYPGEYWENYTKPTGNITLSSSVNYNNVTYTVTQIGYCAFYNCSGLTGSLTIPSSVTSIGELAFYSCSGFNGTLTIPSSVTSIGQQAFKNCSSFTLVKYNASNCANVSSAAKPFENCSGSLIIGNTVQKIPSYMFQYGGFTGSLTISNSVTSIGYAAFNECSGFTGSLTLSDNLNTISSWAFCGCSGLTGNLTIGNSVVTIGQNAFCRCGFTGSLTIPNSVTSLGSHAFLYCTGFNGSLTIGNSVTSIEYETFCGCSGFTGSLIIPNSVTTIGGEAFYGCSSITGSLTIPSSVVSIGNVAFKNCSGFIGSLTIGNSVTSIGDGAFYGCNGFTGSLTIPNSVTTIDDFAFYDCSGFTGSLTIGNSVTSIGNYAFRGCSGFTSMMVFPATPPSLGTNAFYNVPTDIPVYVPCESLEDYQAALGWSAFTNMQCRETLTVYDGTATSFQIPAYITYFDDFTRSQFVIPADELVEMIGTPITSMTFYTTTQNVPYTTLSDADVYLMEVDYTSISAYEPKESATTVYSGRFSIVSADDGGGMMTINFSTPYVYQGGNLLVGIENVEDNGFKYIEFYGQTVSGASISGRNASSTGIIPANQQNFIPKTTFGYQPTCVPKRLPYTYGFEDPGELDCWTMLDCESSSPIFQSAAYQGEYGFGFQWNYNPPQYLISPKFDGTTGMNVSFYYKNASNDWPETFQVGYSTTTKSPNAFTWGTEVTANDQYSWQLYEASFPEGTKYVAIKLTSDDMYYLYLDNFSFEPNLSNIFLTDGYWNDGSHWNTGTVPPADSDVIIQANVTVPAGYLAVANAVSLDGGSITVADGGQLKHNTQGLEVTMKKNIVGYDDANDIRNYYLLSFPFVHIDVPAAMSATGSDFYRFDLNEPNAEWRNLRSETFNIQLLQGYLFASPESNVLSLSGHTYATTTETMWDHVVEYDESSANLNKGWELLGTPLTYNVYIYRQTSDGELVPMPIMMYDANGDLQTICGGPVAPMQGFFVHVTETTTVYFSGEGHINDYVDLGLPSGLLWATCNVGANAPEEYGDYFAWGETTPKSVYNWDTYQHYDGSNLTKYTGGDGLTTLLPEDDAATANWGGNWRMPTKEEFEELYNNTTVTWTQQNGVNGRLFTATNGNSLFLPAAGCRYDSNLYDAGSYGNYWSSSLYTGYPGRAWYFGFGSDDCSMYNYYRDSGRSVRPVCSSRQN